MTGSATALLEARLRSLFHGVGFLSRDSLLEEVIRAGGRGTALRYGLDSAKGCAVVALAYSRGDFPEPAWTEPWRSGSAALRIGAFARADWYGEITARLSVAVDAVAAAGDAPAGDARPGALVRSRGSFRRLANSGLPEKALAVAAGLGWTGRNGILVLDSATGLDSASASSPGSAVLLGVLLLPFEPDEDRTIRLPENERALRSAPGSRCGACVRCVDACPTGALGDASRGFRFLRARCIQHWTTVPGALPPEVEASWRNRLYGCDSCLEACPHFRPDPASIPGKGRLGPSLPSRFFAESGDDGIRTALRSTALGLGWMPPAAFRRSALIGARARADAMVEARGGIDQECAEP